MVECALLTDRSEESQRAKGLLDEKNIKYEWIEKPVDGNWGADWKFPILIDPEKRLVGLEAISLYIKTTCSN